MKSKRPRVDLTDRQTQCGTTFRNRSAGQFDQRADRHGPDPIHKLECRFAAVENNRRAEPIADPISEPC